MDRIPTFKQIKQDLQSFIKLTKNIKTYDDVIKFERDYKWKIEWLEINGELSKDFNENTPIEYIRVDMWGCLSYVYIFFPNFSNITKGKRVIIFDVLADSDDYVYDCFLAQDVMEKDLTKENYNKWVKAFMHREKDKIPKCFCEGA